MSAVARPAARSPRVGSGHLGLLLGAVVLLAGGIAGYAGQSLVAIGAPDDVQVSAAVVATSGGLGSSQPVRVSLQVGVVNSGAAKVRITGSWADTATASIRGLNPATLSVPGNTRAELTLDVEVRCSWPAGLTVPALRLEGPAGRQQALPVAGDSTLTQACATGDQNARPLTLAAARPVAGALEIVLTSPTGRTATIQQIRAEGIVLAMTPPQPAVTGGTSVTVSLRPPADCPPQWQLTGVPTSLVLDLSGGAQLRLRVGAPEGAWLLGSSCSPDPAAANPAAPNPTQ